MLTVKSLIASTVFITLTACTGQQSTPSTPVNDKAAESVELPSGVNISALDTSVRPQDDFYQYANGGWLNTTEIPDIYSGYSIYTEVYEEVELTLREIIENSAKATNPKGSEAQKVGDLFAAWMDQASIESKGLGPLKEKLDELATITDKQQLLAIWAQFIRDDVEVPFGYYISPNLKNSSEYAVYFGQDGLTLSDRDYYLQLDNENFAKARNGLPGFIKTMLSFVDSDMSDKRANAVYQLEHQLAENQWDKVKNRNDELTYNPYQKSELGKLGSEINWSALLDELGLGEVDEIIISQPSYFLAVDKLLADIDLQTWKDYLAYNLLRRNSAHLTLALDEANFEFMSKTLRGQSTQRPRWKRGIAIVNGSLGEVVGKLYVEQRFPKQAKEKMNELVANVMAVFDESIDGLDWMSEDTKKAAKIKRSKFTTKVGYPDEWRDYSALEIVAGDHFGNIRRTQEYKYNREINKLGKPIDRNEWFMTPQTVNAYYDPTQNEIVFPAARLQPPFFQLNADDAINYGAIGGVIGHEISHGFDDSGSKYDGDGNLNNWWSEADRKAFEQRTKVLVEQYNQYSPIEGMTINGELTLGENIGDLSGVTVAYKAYIRSLQGQESPVIDGFTGAQRFFIGYAMSRKGKYKKESAINRLASDPHSPLKYRVNGVYRNMDEFHQAFNVKEGDAMWLAPEQRVILW
ncbi:MAG: putative endopeptidase [Paraglaciecola sp.]|jgi:putative endopeptidase